VRAHRIVVAHDQSGLARPGGDDTHRQRVLPFRDQRKVGTAGNDDIETCGRQRLMRARRPAEIGAFDVEAVLAKDAGVDADLQRHKGDGGGDGDADAQLLGGAGMARRSEGGETDKGCGGELPDKHGHSLRRQAVSRTRSPWQFPRVTLRIRRSGSQAA
jgi:hypothetical protein